MRLEIMRMLMENLSCYKRKQISSVEDGRSNYIFYKIVDVIQRSKVFVLQCINTKGTFLATLQDIVSDVDILYGLHPVQACYIGMRYAQYSKNLQGRQRKIENTIYAASRYGSCYLSFYNRDHEVCFVNRITQKEHLVSPQEIAFCESLISEFDAIEAYFIGLVSNSNSCSSLKKFNKKVRPLRRRPKLRVVK